MQVFLEELSGICDIIMSDVTHSAPVSLLWHHGHWSVVDNALMQVSSNSEIVGSIPASAQTFCVCH